jgi:hypothetical protein
MKKLIHIKSDLQRNALAKIVPEIPDGHFVKIMPEEGIRRYRHNRYYWKAVLEPMAAHYGGTKNELHQNMKKRYLYPMMLATDEDFNDMIEAVRDVYRQGLKAQAIYMMEFVYSKLTTTKLSTKLFHEYVEEVKSQAVTDNIKLPTKEEYERGNYD